MLDEMSSSIAYRKEEVDYQQLRLNLENERLTMEKQRRELFLVLISLSAILLVSAGYIIYLRQRKRMQLRARLQHEQLLKLEATRLEHENLMLKQAPELTRLREKDAQLPEALFRRMTL